MQRISLADDWYVYPRDDAFSLVTSIPGDAVRTSVPYDALWAEGPRASAPSGGATAYFDGQVYYYQRELVPEAAWEGKRLYLRLEGAFATSFVYVNGSQVATGSFGYASITADITDYVRLGAPNTLLVVCKAEPHSSRWYAGLGLLRPVYLLVADAVHAEPDSFVVRTEGLDADGARVRVEARLRNCSGAARNVDVRVRVADGATVLAEATYPVRVRDGLALNVPLFVPCVRPWSDNDPQLYDVSLAVGADETCLRTGFATVTTSAAHGLLVNGRPVLLRGACIHHDEGLLGGVSTYAYERWRVGLLKEKDAA